MNLADAKKSLPPHIWGEAEKQAGRSTLTRHKTGAVVFNKDFEIISKGCSYHVGFGAKPTVHAEENALSAFRGADSAIGLDLLVYAVGRNRPSYSSRPCYACLGKIVKVGIGRVLYLERMNDGEYILNIETPNELNNRSLESNFRLNSYAREMRII